MDSNFGFLRAISISRRQTGTHQTSAAVDAQSKFGSNGDDSSQVQMISLPMEISEEKVRNRFLARQMLLNCDKRRRKEAARPDYAYVGNDYFEVFLMRKVASSYLEDIVKIFSPDKQSHYGFKGESRILLVTVRDPYTRMASGYIDRVLTNQDKLRLFTPQDVQKFWPNATALEAEARCLNAISFKQFVKYLIYFHKEGKFIDGHFQTMSFQCNPCDANVDYIVHLETLFEDLSYIFKTLKINATVPPTDGAFAIERKPRLYKAALSVDRPCQSMCSAYRNLWWSYHARGLVASRFPFPLDDKNCESTPPDEFTKIALDAYHKSRHNFNKSAQKRKMMVELFLQLSLEDRLELRDMFADDFKLFGYDPQPADLFPEMFKGSKE